MSRNTPLTTGEIATHCHVTAATVSRWIRAGSLKANSTPGGHYRVESSEFRDFLKRQGMPVPGFLQLEGGDGERRRVLVVDDEPSVLDLIVRALENDGPYLCETATSGYEACLRAGVRRPDLVILDLVMPGVDGFEVCREIKSHSETSSCKILALTGYPDEGNVKRILQYGADRWLRKPVEIEELREEVARLLGVVRAPRGGRRGAGGPA
ncbi:MAG: response regulator [Planctomycetales bacterium]|nr:response regulator [Planctomycetales bacterium]